MFAAEWSPMRPVPFLAFAAALLLAAGARAEPDAWPETRARKPVSARAESLLEFGRYNSLEETQALHDEREGCLKAAKTPDACLDVVLRIPASTVDPTPQDRATMEAAFATVDRLYPVDEDVLAYVRERPTGDLVQGLRTLGAAEEAAARWFDHGSAEHLRRVNAAEVAAWRAGAGDGGGSILVTYLETVERRAGPDSLEAATYLNNHAARRAGAGSGAGEADVAMLRRAVEIRRRALGEDDRRTAISKANLGHALIGLGRYREAEPWLRQAEAAFSRLGAPVRTAARATSARLADALEGQGRRVEAEALRRDVLAALKSDARSPRGERSDLLQALARSAVEAGRHAEAETLLTEALDLEKAIAAEARPIDPARLIGPGDETLYRLMPQWRETALETARREQRDAAARRRADVRLRLARARLDQGDPAGAERRAEEAEADLQTYEGKQVLAAARLMQGRTDVVEGLLLSAENPTLPADHPHNIERLTLLSIYHLLWSPSHAPRHLRQAVDAALGRAEGARSAPGAARSELDQHRDLFRAQVVTNWLVAARRP